MSTDTDTMTAQEVAMAILDGEYDASLDALSDAAHTRRKELRKKEGQMNALFLSAGDRVTLKGLSPKYLNGTVVEVVKINKTRAVVKPIEGETSLQATHRIGAAGCRVPLSCMTKVED